LDLGMKEPLFSPCLPSLSSRTSTYTHANRQSVQSPISVASPQRVAS
jgi:hypothetical protein